MLQARRVRCCETLLCCSGLCTGTKQLLVGTIAAKNTVEERCLKVMGLVAVPGWDTVWVCDITATATACDDFLASPVSVNLKVAGRNGQLPERIGGCQLGLHHALAHVLWGHSHTEAHMTTLPDVTLQLGHRHAVRCWLSQPAQQQSEQVHHQTQLCISN